MNDWIFDCIVDALSDARASIDCWSHAFTWLVIIGVALETVFLWVDHRSDFKAWFFSRTHFKIGWPDRPSRKKFWAEAISVWLVVLGIWGEFHEGSRSGRLETLARQVDGLRNTLLQQEAGDAATNAEKAHQAANAIGESARKATREALAATVSAKRLGELETQQRIALQRANLVLFAKSSGHIFRPKTFEMLKRAKRSNVTVQVVCGVDAPTISFSQNLVEAFGDLGWTARPTKYCALPAPEVREGITIFNKSIESKDFFGHPTQPVSSNEFPEIEPQAMQEDALFHGMDASSRYRMSYLTLCVAARLSKDPTLDDDSFRIVIGEGARANTQ